MPLTGVDKVSTGQLTTGDGPHLEEVVRGGATFIHDDVSGLNFDWTREPKFTLVSECDQSATNLLDPTEVGESGKSKS